MTAVIEAEGLVKRFGRTEALRGVDLAAERGSVLALLGPNGAGKTTAVRVLATLLKPDAGRARIAGYDVLDEAVQVRQLIALTGQFASVDEELTGTENLVMIGRLLGLRRAGARGRAAELLERFELTGAAGRPARTYSGGMRRRLDLAATLVGEPQVLFLDEATTGLDPPARSQVWETIRGVVASGATVLLTTQYLEEADELADRRTSSGSPSPQTRALTSWPGPAGTDSRRTAGGPAQASPASAAFSGSSPNSSYSAGGLPGGPSGWVMRVPSRPAATASPAARRRRWPPPAVRPH